MRQRRRRGGRVMVPVASMGDIAFLLIIFFMICGEFVRDRNPPVPLPLDPYVEELEDAGAIFVTIDGEGRIFLQSERVEDIGALEHALAALLDQDASGSRIVTFKCHRDATADVYEPVVRAIAAAGGRMAALGDLGDEP